MKNVKKWRPIKRDACVCILYRRGKNRRARGNNQGGGKKKEWLTLRYIAGEQ